MAERGAPELVRRLSSSAVLSWQVVLVTSAIAIVGELAGAPGMRSAPPLPRACVFIVALLCMFAVIAIFRPVVNLFHGPYPRAIVAVGSMALAAAVQGLTVGLLNTWVGLVVAPGLENRVPAAIWFLTTALCVATVAADATFEHNRAVRALTQEQSRLRNLREEISEQIALDAEVRAADLRNLLVAELDQISETTGELAVSQFQRIASEVVRPMSHALDSATPDLVEGEIPARRGSTIKRWVSELVRPPLLSVGWMTGLLAWLLMGYATSLFGWQRSLGLTVMTAFVTAGIVWLSNVAVEHVRRRFGPYWALASAAVAVVIITACISGTMRLITANWRFSETIHIAGVVMSIVAVLLIFIKASTTQRARTEQEAMAVRDDLLWETTRLREQLWQQRRLLVRGLHGTVQATIHAEALRLSLAGAHDQVEADEIGLAKQSVMRAVRSLVADQQESLTILAERLCATWRDICEISFDIGTAERVVLDADPVARQAASDVITEGCSNAVLHGGASVVKVVVREHSKREILIEIIDDGSGAAGGTRGLGSRMYDALCMWWERREGADGSTLVCCLPVRFPEQPVSP